MPFSAKGYLGWDGKRYVMWGADDMGGGINLSSTGWDAAGTTIVFTGDMYGMGQKFPGRFTFVKDGDKKMNFKAEGQMGGQWIAFGDDACKR
jgi:hypothetical protein